MKLLEKIKLNYGNSREREIRILEVPIVQYGKRKADETQEKYFEIFPNKSFEKRIINKIVSSVDNKYDHIYLLRCGLGESYLINYFIKSYCKKNNSKNPYFLNPQKKSKHWDVYSQIPMGSINIDWDLLKILKKESYIVNNKKIFIFYPFAALPRLVKKDKNHLDLLLKFAGLNSKNIEPIKFSIDIQIVDKCTKLLSRKNINIDNFVLLSPDALSVPLIPNEFWEDLKLKLKTAGYDVYTKSKELTVSETVYLASKAKAVIALRSGFSEGLSATAKKMFVLYTHLKTPYLPVKEFISSYSLKKYPYINSNNIYEYDAEKLNKKNIISDILERIGNL